jgi:hypothetical protein
VSKKIYTDARIILGGKDISDHVTRWAIEGRVGKLYAAELDIIARRDVIEIVQGAGYAPESVKRSKNGTRVAVNDKILIKGVDISRWISGYDLRSHVGELDTIRLYVLCDAEVLSINDTTPWEKK